MICRSCKTTFYLGYGGAEFSKKCPELFEIATDNAHRNHDTYCCFIEYCIVIGADLYNDHPEMSKDEIANEPSMLIARDYENYQRVDLTKQ